MIEPISFVCLRVVLLCIYYDKMRVRFVTGCERKVCSDRVNTELYVYSIRSAYYLFMANNAADDGLSDFIGVPPRLFGIAYRMLGSAVEAEDVVQDAGMRGQTTDRSAVLNPAAFLVTTTTRLSINVAESARSRHETYVGPWLPEPIDTSEDPRLGAEREEALELAVLLLLEKLTPTERAAYTLREAFDYPYKEIAEILQLTEANTRQLVQRAMAISRDLRRSLRRTLLRRSNMFIAQRHPRPTAPLGVACNCHEETHRARWSAER